MEKFNIEESLLQKNTGMDLAAAAKKEDLAYAREIAKTLARNHPDRICYADMVQELLADAEIDLGPAAGSLFTGKCWKWTEKWHTSTRVSNHGRLQRIWRLEE